jgi:type II secretory ATPase GspE/PulE/Tfp pilus assembly ATPase PilB-like protein
MAELHIMTKGQPPTIIALDRPKLTIGRQADNDVVLKDPGASRHHCVIEKANGQYHLKDLQTRNGTWIGENRVVEAILDPDEPVRIGQTTLRIFLDPAEKAPAANLPVAELMEDEPPEELPQGTLQRGAVAARLAVRAMVSGPLSKQLGPLMEACVHVPPSPGAPQVAKDVRLLTRKSEAVKIGKGAADRTGEALEALRQLLFVAFRVRATDIHIEAKAEVYAIRFRIDGVMQPVGEVTTKVALAILNVIKILCDIDIAKRSVVQEGNFAVDLPTRRVDFRINLTPTVHGQKLALRILDKGNVPTQFENLGMDLDAVGEFQRVCELDSGMVILSGPTGSGKTTTLYTGLQSIDSEARHIITIEDPVEYELSSTTQISIDAKRGVSFASVLSSVLRQDPDVILVGEVRDEETARLAMQAATTGHLVFTTIHARDTIGTIFRLLDLHIEPFLVANAVTLCVSQRLVRTLCPDCKRSYKPDARMIRGMNLEGRPHGDFFEAVGCRRCMGTGYRGRMAIFEMLMFNQAVRDVTISGPTIAQLRKAGGEWMFSTLADSGRRKVIEGVTTIQEVERVSGMS